MKLSELVEYQQKWESIRGIKNPNNNLDRTQEELNEAKEETDPFKRLVEMVDVLIITAGGMAKICDELHLPYEEVDNILGLKLALNNVKYRNEVFNNTSTEEAFIYCRKEWELKGNPSIADSFFTTDI